jgi:hypothetical protein
LAVRETGLDHAFSNGGGEFHGFVGTKCPESLDPVGKQRQARFDNSDGCGRSDWFIGEDGVGKRGEEDENGKDDAHV